MSYYLVPLRLGLHDLLIRPRLTLAMSMLIAVSVAVFTTLQAYRTSLTVEFNHLAPNLLVVQETQGFGEIYGSRLSPQIGAQLGKLGIHMVVPEIHVITGTSAQNASLIRGIDLQHYLLIDTFTILSGRIMRPGDPPRSAMIGSLLASNWDLKVGSGITLRGRNFKVLGIFHIGTYADNEAWISIEDAQDLLGWGQDVSTYVIPDEGILHEGDTPFQGVSVARKGEGVRFEASQWQPVIDLMGVVSTAMGTATAMALANILWRSAWARRREMAILRTNGFSIFSLVTYLLTQAAGVTLLGIAFGTGFTLLLTSGVQVAVHGFTLNPRLNLASTLSSVGWVGLILLAGCLLPAWWLNHMNLAQMLNSK
jgi:ABC-type antimicrobial peptide transport system permease subunit